MTSTENEVEQTVPPGFMEPEVIAEGKRPNILLIKGDRKNAQSLKESEELGRRRDSRLIEEMVNILRVSLKLQKNLEQRKSNGSP